MPDDLGAVIDTPEVDVEIGNQGQDVDIQIDPAADPAPAQTETTEVKDITDWRKVPAELKEFFKTPAGKGAKDAWFERNAYKELLPEGVKQAKEILGFLEEHGGKDGLTTALTDLQSKASEYEALSQKIEAGDASLVTDLPPETISKLAPVMVEQWKQADPEGWSAAMSGVMAATLQSNRIPLFLERLALNLEYGKLDEVKTQVQQLKEWEGSFAAKAQVQGKAGTAQPNAKFTEREQALNQREEQAFRSDMERSVDSFREPLISKELDTFFKRRPNDTEAKDLAVSNVKSEVIKRLSADQGYQKSLNALWARKDKEGALRLIKSRETAAITEVAPKIGRLIFGNPGPVSKQTDAAKPATKVDAGFGLVDKAPAPHLIDRTQTTDAMIMRGKFILKDGRKLALQD